jgi:succinyl-CoA synthetase beta subunit
MISNTLRTASRLVTPGAVHRGAPAAAGVGGIRRFNLHEYQSKEVMDKYGIRTQNGKEASTAAEAKIVAEALKKANPGCELILKAQVHAGGRGKGFFKENGLKGGVKVLTEVSEVEDFAEQMLGNTLVTKQTGEEGQPCSLVLVNEGLQIDSEKYFAILMDRDYNGPVMVASSQGGMDIEEVAETNPEAIVTEAIDIFAGVQPEQTERLARAMGFKEENIAEAQKQMSNMYDMFIGTDSTQCEINPFAEGSYVGRDEATTVFCVDAKLGFDANSEFRHKELFALRDTSMEDARDVEADEIGVEYIGLDGNIGCMVNGAGLAMGTMDIIKLKGGDPANFCDLGGGVNEQQVSAAFGVVAGDPNVKAVLVNIFGGIVQCDIVAEGIVKAYKNSGSTLPLIVRLEGTNAEAARDIIEKAAISTLISAEDLDDAAIKAVASIQ